ncbi:hypothetical protein XENOCAPTIV_000514 [Xenoophorus captivus]|uniref:Uncharacterized protein n=1 Tax=Xenoophorus captivus TaxID=1517983 RepID=A0ABV0RG76_9TELE
MRCRFSFLDNLIYFSRAKYYFAVLSHKDNKHVAVPHPGSRNAEVALRERSKKIIITTSLVALLQQQEKTEEDGRKEENSIFSIILFGRVFSCFRKKHVVVISVHVKHKDAGCFSMTAVV